MATSALPSSTATLPQGAAQYAITIPIKSRYENWIDGTFSAPVRGQYFSNPTPITGQHLCDVARSTAEDVELALDAAHRAAPAWGRTSATHRAIILNKIADRLEESLEAIAVIETDLDECDFDLYRSIHTAPDDYADLVLELSRTAIEPLMNRAAISGAEAFRAWFPEDSLNPAAV